MSMAKEALGLPGSSSEISTARPTMYRLDRPSGEPLPDAWANTVRGCLVAVGAGSI